MRTVNRFLYFAAVLLAKWKNMSRKSRFAWGLGIPGLVFSAVFFPRVVVWSGMAAAVLAVERLFWDCDELGRELKIAEEKRTSGKRTL